MLIIRHKKFKDVCLKVNSVESSPEKFHLIVSWYNQGFVNSYPLGRTDYVTIDKKELTDWLKTEETLACYRDANWEALNSSDLESL
jgi:hypothetical protein